MLCECGCGQETALAPKTDTRTGVVKGQPLRFVNGHNRRRGYGHDVVDTGYDTPCHLWTGAVHPTGYPSSGMHVSACEAANGPKPTSGHIAHHKCEQKKCVRGDHLEWVTRPDHARMHKVGSRHTDEARAKMSAARSAAWRAGTYEREATDAA